MPFVRRHPLVAFFGIAYGLSWAYWVPLALSGTTVFPGSTPTHFPGLLGPAIAAFIVTALTEGRSGVITLCHRRQHGICRPSSSLRPIGRWRYR